MEKYSKQDLTRCCQCGEPIGDEPYRQRWVYGRHADAMGLERCMHHVHERCLPEYNKRWKKAEDESAGACYAAIMNMVNKPRPKSDDDDEDDDGE